MLLFRACRWSTDRVSQRAQSGSCLGGWPASSMWFERLQSTSFSAGPLQLCLAYDTLACIRARLGSDFFTLSQGLSLRGDWPISGLMHCSETISWGVLDLPVNGCVVMTFLVQRKCRPLLRYSRSRLPASPGMSRDACIRCLLESGCLLERPVCISYHLHGLHPLISVHFRSAVGW